jgi:hypothetical protein
VLWDNVSTTFSCKSPLFEINAELNDAGVYLFSETDNAFIITASHPTRVNGTVKVSVDRTGYGEGCTRLVDAGVRTTTVTLTLPASPQLLGASVSTQCKKQSNKDFHT